MNTADRRAEIINILLVRRRITAKELADEFSVTTYLISIYRYFGVILFFTHQVK